MIEVVVGLRNSAYKNGLKQMRGETRKFAGGVKGMFLGIFGGAAILAGVRGFVKEMAKLQAMARRTGESAEFLQKLGVVAEQNGTSLQAVNNLLVRMQRRAGEAARGIGESGKAFDLLGISAYEFLNLNAEERLIMIASAFKKFQKEGTGTATIMKLLDVEGRELIPMFELLAKSGGEAFEGINVIADESVEKMAKFDASVKKAWQNFKAFAVDVATRGAKTFGSSNFGVQPTQEQRDQWKEQAEKEKGAEDAEKSAKGDAARKAAADASVADAKAKQEEEAAKELAKAKEAHAKKVADAAEKEASYQRDQLAHEEKIIELEKLRDEAAKKANETTEEGLKAKGRQLELEQEITDTIREREAKDREEGRDANERQKANRQAAKEEAADKLKRDKAKTHSDAKRAKEDVLSEAEERKNFVPTLTVSSMQSVGGGGSRFAGGAGGETQTQLVKRQNDIMLAAVAALNEIIQNTAPQEGAGKPVAF